MNPLKSNFKRNNIMEAEVCIKKCRTENNEHLLWCKFINEESDYRYNDILNRNLQDKVGTFKQIQINEEIRKEERRKDRKLEEVPLKMKSHRRR